MEDLLTGLRIIDSTTMVAMPTATHILADMGAEVIKIENHTAPRSEGGGVFLDNKPGSKFWNRDGLFHMLQRSKLDLTLNLRTDEGQESFKSLASISDVIIENNRAGSMGRLGLDYEEIKKIKPDIIYVSNTGFGYTGPWQQYAGIGRMFELTCGLSQLTGYTDEGPRRVGAAFYDVPVGWTAVFAIMSALLHRQKTGEGQWIDFAMYQIGVSTIGDTILDFVANKRNGQVMGNAHPFYAPHNVYQTEGEDKWIAIGTENDTHWNNLCEIMNNPDWSQSNEYSDSFSRYKNREQLDLLLSDWTKTQNNLQLSNLLQSKGVPAGPVLNSKELLLDEHLNHRQFYERITHNPSDDIGEQMYSGRAWKMSNSTTKIRGPGPALGEHNDYILSQLLGYDEDTIGDFYDLGIISDEPNNQRSSTNPPSLEQLLEEGTISEFDVDFKSILGLA
jgi:benzylsuccinate CoA-transferase BbsF subunit